MVVVDMTHPQLIGIVFFSRLVAVLLKYVTGEGETFVKVFITIVFHDPSIPITYCGLMAVYDEPAMFTAEIAVSVIVVAAKVLSLDG